MQHAIVMQPCAGLADRFERGVSRQSVVMPASNNATDLLAAELLLHTDARWMLALSPNSPPNCSSLRLPKSRRSQIRLKWTPRS